jgi:hypothetical protein
MGPGPLTCWLQASLEDIKGLDPGSHRLSENCLLRVIGADKVKGHSGAGDRAVKALFEAAPNRKDLEEALTRAPVLPQ